MNKKIVYMVFVALMLVVVPVSMAKTQGAGTGATAVPTKASTSTGGKISVSPTPVGIAVQNQTGTKTQNMGEEQQMMVQTQETEMAGELKQLSEVARQNMGEVAKGVEEILNDKTLKGEVGDQVKLMAQEQKQIQEQIQVQVNKIEERGGLVKALIGPNYGAVKSLEKQTEQNQVMVQQLAELKNKLQNMADKTMIQETIQAMINQNTSLREMIGTELRTGSAFGWLFRLFAR